MDRSLGPHTQMATLAREMALMYEKDEQLSLAALLSHYLDEVDINIASDKFDHRGFIDTIRDNLCSERLAGGECRRSAFILAAIEGIEVRAGKHVP